MSWKSQKHLKRIFNLFKRAKEKKILFQEDIDAFKELSDIIDELTQMQIKDNLLFQKLVANYLFMQTLNNCDIKQSIKKVNEILCESLENHLEKLKIALNDKEIINYFNSLGIKEYDGKIETIEDLEKNKELVSTNQQEIIKKLNSSYEFKSVEKSFNRTIYEMLMDLNNYK